jgi:hypothetical protein
MLKVTLFMEEDSYTWTETHYYAGGVYPLSLAAQNEITFLANARTDLLGQYATMFDVRAVDVAQPRLASYLDVSQFNRTGAFGQGGNYMTPADRAYSAILARFFGVSPTAIKNAYLAGAPDNIIGEGGPGNGLLTLGMWAPYFANYVTALSNGFSFRTLLYTNSQPVVSFIQAAGVQNGNLGVQVAAPFAFPGKQALSFKGFRKVNLRLPGLEGVKKIDSIVPPVAPSTLWTYYVQASVNILESNVLLGGIAAPLLYGFSAYQPPGFESAVIRRAVERKRGGSAFLPHGKLRTR